MNPFDNGAATRQTVRCAIYTRKSTEEGLEKEFNSLDAQRATAEAYIASQQHEGWVCLPERYDDGGYTGGNLERPALLRLMADLAAGHIDCVLVQKVDRLSRSLLDFARIMELFDQHQVAFVSVTQQFCTATSVGRLILNVLLSFAQFERELIAERTRDKIAATRRQGKWVGGLPILGYDLDPRTPKLRLNEAEAARVRAIFALYLEHQALWPVVRELERRGWRTKRWRTRQGRERGGRRFTRNHLRQLLTNVLYTGQIRYRNEVHPGEHPAIVDGTAWQQVQTLLQRNRHGQRPARSGAWLQGLLRCVACGSGMTPSQSTRGTRLYRYYVCLGAQKRGWHTCPAPSVPAEQVEHLVIEQLQGLENAPAHFGSLFEALGSAERCRLVQLLVQRVDYHGSEDKLTITLVPGGPLALAEQLAQRSAPGPTD
jgi:site-specific DNA recombinase